MALKVTELAERAKNLAGENRLAFIQYGLLIAFIIIGFRLWSLQVIHHEEYVKKAENNRLKTIPIPAPRGFVYDRGGQVLVENYPTLIIIMSREDVQSRGKTVSQVIDELIARGLNLDRSYVDTHLEMLRRQPLWYPVVIKENAGPQDVAWARAHQLEYPELDVVEQPVRRYPDGGLLAHVVGYVGEISPQQLEQPEYKDQYRPGDIIGKAGVEKVYDRLLRGRDGMRRVIVDSTGREVGEIERVDPIPGQDIRLAIDLDLQRLADQQLGDRRGVVLAMDPRNGEILAMISHPTFDPNLFSQRITTPEGKAEYRALLNDPQHPLYARAIQGNYPTGSTWKPLVATASLEEGVITRENSKLLCGGGLQVGNRFVRCMGSHGMPDIHRAIVVSCDAYFYRLGLKLGVDRMHDWVKRMGMGQRTGIDLPNERGGIIPGRDIKAKLNPRDPKWRDHDTVIASVGQGTVAVTPLQLLRAYSGIAMGGRFHTPHLFLGAGPPTQQVVYTADKPVTISLSQQTTDIITHALWGVVNEAGTGTRARVVGFDVSGKTGTAQVVALDKTGGKFRDHAWFVSFAPRANPEIAVVALVENVGFGGTHSAPIARAIFEAYRNEHYGPPNQVQIANRVEVDESPELLAEASEASTQAAADAAIQDETQPQLAPERVDRALDKEPKVKAVNPPRPAEVEPESESPAPPLTPVKRRPKLVNQREQPKASGGAAP
ncbi:MAG: penicillin-binding protein 2 [Acidobacteria bacterium]|nr:penicillin-binding protein 2 [Acidobacteriota bacterium]